jgi:hypothetical protein
MGVTPGDEGVTPGDEGVTAGDEGRPDRGAAHTAARDGAGARGGGDLLGARGRVVAGLVVFVLYTVSFLLRGAVLPGLVGGALAGLLAFLLLREAEDRRRRRRRS